MIGVSSGDGSVIGQGWRAGKRKQDPSSSPGIEQQDLRGPRRHAPKGRTLDGKDGVYAPIDPSSSKAINDDLILEPKYKIFLSHSGVQEDFVDHLCKALEEHCPYPFFDGSLESFSRNKNFLDWILMVAQQSQLFVVVISEEYFMSKWPMVELNAFVKAKKEMQLNTNASILPLFYGLSVSELKDAKRRQRWFEKWETFARDDPRGLIKVEDWKYALDELTRCNGLPYYRGSKQVVEYEKEIVSHICKLVTPSLKWEDSHVRGNTHEGLNEKMKHMATEISPLSLLKEVVNEFAKLSDSTLLTFSTEDSDPVRIEDKDLQSLQPMRHLTINIINFYIKYLEKNVLSIKDKDHFFFFNCSFFISTFGTKTTSIDIDYEHTRLWIRGVNLFEKDYIFIPIHKSLNGNKHWSLIIISHLNNLSRSPTDAHYHSPHIFHLYSVEGKHDDLEGDIRSFILKSWIEIHQNSDILQALFRMKYVEAKVPQEDNGYDSGIYLLYYMEVFILESASSDFNFGTKQGKLHFPLWDSLELIVKRKQIQNLILELGGMTKLQGTLRLHSSDILSWLQFKATSKGHNEDVQNNALTMVNGDVESEPEKHQTWGVTILNEHQPFDVKETPTLLGEETKLSQIEDMGSLLYVEESLLQDNDTPILYKKGEIRRPRKFNWSTTETSVLLRCIVGFDQFPQGNNTTRWDFIVGEVNKVCGTTYTKMQCQYRFDTLSKAFKQVHEFCKANAKDFSEISQKERHEMKLATTLTMEWYTLMSQHYAYKVNYKKFDTRPFNSATSSTTNVQIEASVECPWSPQRNTINLLSSSSGEFQSEIHHEPLVASLDNCHDGTPVPKSLLASSLPRPLVQQRKSRSNEEETKGIYRRAIKDIDGNLLWFKYEPRFKPPKDINPLGGSVTYNMLSLGSYNTLQEAKDVRQIASYYYGQSDAWLDLGNGTRFLIPDGDSIELQSLGGKDKRIWVQRKVKEVFASFQMEKTRLNLKRKKEQLSLANPNPKMQKELVHSHVTL